MASSVSAQTAPPRAEFDAHCARCHGGDGRGGPMGPSLAGGVASRSDEALAALVREGLPAKGMPPVTLSEAEWTNLRAFLRSLAPRDAVAPARTTVSLVDGTVIDATVLHDEGNELQVVDVDVVVR